MESENEKLCLIIEGYVDDVKKIKESISYITDRTILNDIKERLNNQISNEPIIKKYADKNSSVSTRSHREQFYQALEEFTQNRQKWEDILKEREAKFTRLEGFDKNNLTEEQRLEIEKEEENNYYLRQEKEIEELKELNERLKDEYTEYHDNGFISFEKQSGPKNQDENDQKTEQKNQDENEQKKDKCNIF